MFKKLIIATAVTSGLFMASTISAQAQPQPLCQLNPGACAKMPLIPINPIKPKPFPIIPIKYPPVKILPFPLPPSPPPAPPKGPDFGINISVGGGSGGYGGDGFVTCHQARNIVRHHGFRHVHTDTCGDGDYTFLGTKHGTAYLVDVSDSGEILSVDQADNNF